MPWSRKKSCEHCRASKARCNKATPTCSRCSERELHCIYDRRDTDRATPYSYPPSASPHLENLAQAPPLMRISNQLGLGLGEISVVEHDQPLSIGVEDETLPDFDEELQLRWAATDDLGSYNLATPKAIGLPGQEFHQQRTAPRDVFLNVPALPTISTRLSSEGADSGSPWLLEDLYDGSTANRTSSRMTIAIEKPTDERTLTRRGAHKSCPLTSAILGLIASYPKMMTEGDRLPPFIQPLCHIEEDLAQDCAESGKHVCLPKDLAVCASLVRMFYERTAANAAFGWNSIYAEVERLRQEYHKLAPTERVAALQSAMVYLILQAEDPESAAKNGVGALLATVTEMVVDLTGNYDWYVDIPEGRPDRREWVLRESLRRILLLVSIIDLLLEGIIVASASLCQDFRAVPLPSTRDLWDTRTNRGWRIEYAKHLSSKKTNRVLTVGDLIESDEAGCFTNAKNNVRNSEILPDLMKWCEGLDALGTILWMALPYEQYRRGKLACI